jgi:LysM repeat protein
MTFKIGKGLSVLVLLALASCANTEAHNEAATTAFKQADCAKAAGITGRYSTQVTVKNGQMTEVFVPGNGVSEAQAAKANACMKG